MTASHLSNLHKRARKVNQKQERRQAIVDSAWKMFQHSTYEAVTMDAIATAVHLAKGTLFLYFRTKEELFLTIIQQQLTEWFDAVDRQLAELTAPAAVEEVVNVIADSLHERTGLTRLLAILSTVLEQNISYEATLQFKKMLLNRMIHTGSDLQRVLPFLAVGEGAHLLMQFQAIVIGLQHLADPAPVVRQVIAEPQMHAFEIEFDSEFSALALALLKGLERKNC